MLIRGTVRWDAGMTKLARRASRLRDRRDGVLEDQLILRARFEQ